MKTFEKDVTEYARGCGYTGKTPVIVSDSKVKSHRNADWFVWINKIRRVSKKC